MKASMHEALQAAVRETQVGLELLLEGLERQVGIESFIQALIEAHHDGKQALFFAPGRSGLVAQAFASRVAQLDLRTHLIGSLTALSLKPGDLLILISSSGRTRLTRFIGALGKKYGAKLLLVTADPRSPLGRMADVVLQVPASPKGKILPLTSFSEQMSWILLDAVVVELLKRLELDESTIAANHPNLE